MDNGCSAPLILQMRGPYRRRIPLFGRRTLHLRAYLKDDDSYSFANEDALYLMYVSPPSQPAEVQCTVPDLPADNSKIEDIV